MPHKVNGYISVMRRFLGVQTEVRTFLNLLQGLRERWTSPAFGKRKDLRYRN